MNVPAVVWLVFDESGEAEAYLTEADARRARTAAMERDMQRGVARADSLRIARYVLLEKR